MKSALIGVIALLAPLAMSPAAYAKAADKPAAAKPAATAAAKPAAKDDRNYDCSKAGNANKTACKDAKPAAKAAPAKAATPSAKAMPATPAKAATPAAKAAPAPVAAKDERNYDCTKAGNANKTACKEAAKDERNYDCTKAGNANKTACKGVVQAKAAAPAAPAAKSSITPPPAPKVVASTAKGAGIGPKPVGATAQCSDGSYSSSQTRQGTCSTHGGVAKWF